MDEVPPNVSLTTPFGQYVLSYTVRPGQLAVTRTLDVPLQTVGPEQYADARAFFDAVRSADTALIVWKR